MGSTTATLDAAFVREGITMDASGVVIGALSADKLRTLIRLVDAAGHSLSLDSSEHLIVSPSPADTGNA